jgi:hypothetical protein
MPAFFWDPETLFWQPRVAGQCPGFRKTYYVLVFINIYHHIWSTFVFIRLSGIYKPM